jgi:hypothetical protein
VSVGIPAKQPLPSIDIHAESRLIKRSCFTGGESPAGVEDLHVGLLRLFSCTLSRACVIESAHTKPGLGEASPMSNSQRSLTSIARPLSRGDGKNPAPLPRRFTLICVVCLPDAVLLRLATTGVRTEKLPLACYSPSISTRAANRWSATSGGAALYVQTAL